MYRRGVFRSLFPEHELLDCLCECLGQVRPGCGPRQLATIAECNAPRSSKAAGDVVLGALLFRTGEDLTSLAKFE